jgi:hypothetical protein
MKIEISSDGDRAFMQTMRQKMLLSGSAIGSPCEVNGLVLTLGLPFSAAHVSFAKVTESNRFYGTFCSFDMPKSSLLWHRLAILV